MSCEMWILQSALEELETTKKKKKTHIILDV